MNIFLTSPRPRRTHATSMPDSPTVLMVTDLRGPLKGVLSGRGLVSDSQIKNWISLSLWVRLQVENGEAELDDHFLRIKTCSQSVIFPQHSLIQNLGPGILETPLHSATYSAKAPWNKSLNFIFPIKYVIPKSLKVGHWLSQAILQPYAWPSCWVIYFLLLSLPCPSLLQLLQVFQGKEFASKNASVPQLRHWLQPCNLVPK